MKFFKEITTLKDSYTNEQKHYNLIENELKSLLKKGTNHMYIHDIHPCVFLTVNSFLIFVDVFIKLNLKH